MPGPSNTTGVEHEVQPPLTTGPDLVLHQEHHINQTRKLSICNILQHALSCRFWPPPSFLDRAFLRFSRHLKCSVLWREANRVRRQGVCLSALTLDKRVQSGQGVLVLKACKLSSHVRPMIVRVLKPMCRASCRNDTGSGCQPGSSKVLKPSRLHTRYCLRNCEKAACNGDDDTHDSSGGSWHSGS